MKSHKRSLSIRSPTVMIGGNDDLLIEILLLLPAKSLIRFQLVSKHWRSLISSRTFSGLHTLRHHCHRPKPQPSFLLRTDKSQFFICHPTINRLVPFHFPLPNVKILQSCNGLLLLECTNPQCRYKQYYVCNPTTMQSRNLNLRIHRAFSGICLIFDPCKSSHYKVVCFRREIRSHYIQFSVYDSQTHEWKEGGDFNREPLRFLDGIYWNDKTYFIRYRGSSSFCFSHEDEKIYSIPEHPRKQSGGRNKTYTMESNGHLHYLLLSLKPGKSRLYVFEMDENGWYEKYRADFNPIVWSLPDWVDGRRAISLFGMIRGEREEDSILLFRVLGKIMIFRFLGNVFEVLVDYSQDQLYKEHQMNVGFEVDAHQFIERLAPV